MLPVVFLNTLISFSNPSLHLILLLGNVSWEMRPDIYVSAKLLHSFRYVPIDYSPNEFVHKKTTKRYDRNLLYFSDPSCIVYLTLKGRIFISPRIFGRVICIMKSLSFDFFNLVQLHEKCQSIRTISKRNLHILRSCYCSFVEVESRLIIGTEKLHSYCRLELSCYSKYTAIYVVIS